MKDKNWSRWIGCSILGLIEAILVFQMPQVLTHNSNEDLHRFLYLNKSLTYWLFLVIYVCCSVAVAVLWTFVLTNRSIAWITVPTRKFLSKRRSFSWSDVTLSVLITLIVLCVPDMIARANFIHRFSAPRRLLLAYLERCDRNFALYAYTQRSQRVAKDAIVAFRQSQFEYRPYVGFTSVPGFRPIPMRDKKAFRVFFVGGSAMEISAAK